MHSQSSVNKFLHCTANVSFFSHGITCDHNAIRQRSKINHKSISHEVIWKYATNSDLFVKCMHKGHIMCYLSGVISGPGLSQKIVKCIIVTNISNTNNMILSLPSVSYYGVL